MNRQTRRAIHHLLERRSHTRELPHPPPELRAYRILTVALINRRKHRMHKRCVARHIATETTGRHSVAAKTSTHRCPSCDKSGDAHAARRVDFVVTSSTDRVTVRVPAAGLEELDALVQRGLLDLIGRCASCRWRCRRERPTTRSCVRRLGW